MSAPAASEVSVTSNPSANSRGSYLQYDGTKNAATNSAAAAAGNSRMPSQNAGDAAVSRAIVRRATPVATTPAATFTIRNQASDSTIPRST